MGLVYADIELINGFDEELAYKHIIGEDEVKRISINILVDSGALMLSINENIQEYLQLRVVEKKNAITATGQIISCNVVSPIIMRFKNRSFTGSAIVLPGDNEPLLGVIPLEEMDLIIDPARNELLINPEYPDVVHLKLK